MLIGKTFHQLSELEWGIKMPSANEIKTEKERYSEEFNQFERFTLELLHRIAEKLEELCQKGL